ncbi:MAG: putative lipid II flippase FtsW [Betaproteobacteria bacterium]|nr:putative lipid II flippase FtsW [Betaproteobacteria bacterium]
MMIGALDAPRRQLAEIDYALLWSVLMLLFAGLVMVYSASIAIAEAGRFTNHQPAYYLVRHGVFLCIGLVAAGVAFQIPLSLWQKYAPYLFMAGVFMLALVLIPGVGKDVNGARRWLSFGFANLQPSELMKMFAVLYAADYTVRKINVMHDLKQAFAPLFGAMVIVGILLLKEPDFGAFVVIISIAMGILFLGGLKARLFVMLIVGLLFAFAVMIIVSPYRRDRVFGFMDPWADAFGRGYQLSHSLIAFGRGELFGVGLGGSVEKLFYLPEAHTDFLLAVIAEEMGFFGVLAVIALFALIVQRAFAIGRQCVQLDRLYPALVAMGMGIWIGVQSFINMGVNMGLLPTKGLTLPLMSFGGSGILANCVALAILLRVDWENRQLMRGGKV